MLHVTQHLFHDFYVIYYLLGDTDDIVRLLQCFVYCITHSFQ